MRGKGTYWNPYISNSRTTIHLALLGSDTPGTFRAAAQYGVSGRLMDSLTFDVTRNPWRTGDLFDAIVTGQCAAITAHSRFC